MPQTRKRRDLGTQRWKDIRLKVLIRDGYICAYCGQDADSVDHVISRKMGADPFDMDNLVAACRKCNSSKGSKSGFFLRSHSTPPVFTELSLPDTRTKIPDSPFNAPKAG